MPGWIITGVRGEGKSLCAVGKIREYALRGSMIATNLDINVSNLLPPDNNTVIYRLPDKPRLEDLELLPPAYDIDYKDEDKNGLLVLDELGTWLNSRSWNDKTRLPFLNWLFLSRKLHWDIILLAQDYEMIDTQVRNTLCDYLVVSSRLDRQKIPYLAPLLDFIGFNSFLPKLHTYYVFYGFNTQQSPTDKWSFVGTDLYDGYNTNQRFLDGTEVINGQLVDMRATYAYLPASYLSKHYYTQKLQNQIDTINNLVTPMAVKKVVNTNKVKIYILAAFLICFIGWRLFGTGIKLPVSSGASPVPSAVAQPVPVSPSLAMPQPVQIQQPAVAPVAPVQVNQPHDDAKTPALLEQDFIPYLLANTRPRLSSFLYSEKLGFRGYIDFYKGSEIVERFTFQELHALGVLLMKTQYGVNMVYKGKSYIVNYPVPSFAKHDQHNDINTKSSTVSARPQKDTSSPAIAKVQTHKPTKPACEIKSVMTDEEIKACQS